MGLMVSVNQHWVSWMKRVDESSTSKLAVLRRGFGRLWPLPQVLCWAFTMHCFVHSLLVFFGGNGAWRVTWELIRRPWQALAGG
jgi:hypothetical protein